MKDQIPTEQIHDIVSWNDATITGILIAVVIKFTEPKIEEIPAK